MYTARPQCRGLIDAHEYFHLSRCPHCNFDLSKSRNSFKLVVFTLMIVGVWWMYLRFPGQKNAGLPLEITAGLGAAAAWYLFKERRVRRRDRAGVTAYLVTSEAIEAFWRQQARGRPSPAQTTYAALGARAASTAQRLRQHWLTRDASAVQDRLVWAETNLPEGVLFARAESALVQMAQSSGTLYAYAFGGLPGTRRLADEHANHLTDLAELHTQMVAQLTQPSSKDISDDLRQLATQVEGVLRHANLMYA